MRCATDDDRGVGGKSLGYRLFFAKFFFCFEVVGGGIYYYFGFFRREECSTIKRTCKNVYCCKVNVNLFIKFTS